MIDRLRATLGTLSTLGADDLVSPGAEPLRQDCADSLRLQLDCMQAELGATDRATLQRLNDLFEEPPGNGAELAAAIQAALRVVRSASGQ